MAEPAQQAAGQAVEIAKQIFDKMTDAAKAAQTTAEAALPHVVKAYMARQLGVFVAALFLGVAAALLFRWAIKHKMLDRGPREDDWPTAHLFVAIAAGLCAAAALVVAFVNLPATLGVLADPTGMFILGLIGK